MVTLLSFLLDAFLFKYKLQTYAYNEIPSEAASDTAIKWNL